MDKMKVSLNFSVDSFDIEEIKDERFCKGIIHAFADGVNAHTHPIDTEVLMRCANTVYDVPIVGKYNAFVDDFLSHEDDESPIGFVKETSPTYSNPIIFEKLADGRTFMVVRSIIWRRYAKDAIRVLKNSNGRKGVSVEITITDGEEIDGKIKVKEFVLEGITILGDFVNPAVKDAHIQVQFAKDKQDYLDNIENPVNTNQQVGELHMEDMNKVDSVETSADDVAVVKMSEDINCATDAEPKNEEMSCEQDMGCKPEEMSECNDMGCKTEEDMSCQEEMGCKPKEMSADEPADDNQEEMACGEEKMSVEALMAENEQLKSRVEELEVSNKAYMAKIEAMSDYDQLKEFKFATEEKNKRDAQIAKMEQVMSEIVSKYGAEISAQEQESLKAKFSEFGSEDAWTNYVKAQLFDRQEANSGVVSIGLPFAKKKTNSIWDKI